MDDIEVPKYFVCPISLQIMKDPVTAITGITYDRESIEQWLLKGKNTSCPVTQQPLPRDSDLTPNHTLRRLIQAWCTENASLGVDRIPTPKPSVDKFHFRKLIKELDKHPDSKMEALRELDLLAAKNERNRKYMVEAGVPKAMLSFIVNCFKEDCVNGLEEALSVLSLIRIPSAEANLSLNEKDEIIKSLIWVLGCESKTQVTVKSHAALVLKTIIETASSILLERLEPQFFETAVGVLTQRSRVTQQGMNAALHVLLDVCPWGRNRLMMVESGAVSALIELELGSPERRTTELILGILFHLCSCADGRAEFLSHKGGVAVVTKRIMRVSPTADDRAVLILSLISKFSATNLVLHEMLEVGTVTKLCMLLQGDGATYLKDKAMEILRSHSDEWQKFRCINITLLTRYIK
ncbi:PREDICTED: E3 ubiquitin-protein ligase PUB24 [Theobroma cacao]|uniref:U-box domain-containing protein n=2 Tax=Theobroma cacao TaxID=3641 RepID=A0A061F1U4_THECC|nr:PREDICTED: E3 ubiquitin-protein ligase PUB24 [Theobroma cacao]EOY08489.1 Plant U-box 24 [Theobroma cacao]